MDSLNYHIKIVKYNSQLNLSENKKKYSNKNIKFFMIIYTFAMIDALEIWLFLNMLINKQGYMPIEFV